MSCCRYLLVFPTFAALLFLSGALSTAPSSPTLSTSAAQDPPAKADPAALQILEQALAQLDPRRVAWLEMDLWQQVTVQDLTYQAEGRYLAGPDHRLRLDLKTRIGGTAGWLQVVSDGTTLWQARCIGAAGTPQVTRIDLKGVRALLNSPGILPQVRDEFFQGQSFGGVETLLRRLERQVVWTRKELVRRNGQILHKLTGAWQASAPAPAALAEQPAPAGLARQARLYLDQQTLWPHRLEWWGANPPHTGDVLLVEMEFRNPVLNRPLPAENLDKEFAFSGNTSNVPDHTEEVLSRLQTRAQELAPRPGVDSKP